MLFEDQWKQPGFAEQTQKLALELRARFELPAVHQLGVVVRDVVETSARLEGEGLGPFFVASGVPKRWDEGGVSAPMAGTLAVAYREGIEVELLGPGTGTDFYRQSLRPNGGCVVHHLAYLVPDVDARAAQMQAAGFQLKVRGLLANLGLRFEFAYLDTVAACGFFTELLDVRALGLKISPKRVYPPLARLQKIIGVRSFKL